MKNRLTQICKISYNLPDIKSEKYLRFCDETCTCVSCITKYNIPTKLKQQNILPKYSYYQILYHLVKHMANLHNFIFSFCFIYFNFFAFKIALKKGLNLFTGH